MMTRIISLVWNGCLALAGCSMLSGCQPGSSADQEKLQAKSPDQAPGQKAQRKGVFKRPDTAIEGDSANDDNGGSRSPAFAKAEPAEVVAPPRVIDPVGDVVEALQDSSKLGPMLVVWLVDRTSSAEPLVRETMDKVQKFYHSLEKAEGEKSTELAKVRQALKTAVVSFGETATSILEPTADAREVARLLQGLKQNEEYHEKPFAALIETIAKFQSLRTAERRELMFVIVTDEAGDDTDRLEELLAQSRRSGARFYAIGYPATLGRRSSGVAGIEGPRPAKGVQSAITVLQGPDTRQPDLVDLAGLRDEPIDAGVGPFAWEYLCRTSGGFFSVVREGSGRDGRMSGLGYGRWPSGAKRYSAKSMSEYAPAYISQSQYDEQLSKNAACRALVAAAALERVEQLPSPDIYFSKRNEAQLTQALGRAQRVPARVEPEINKLYEILRAGEGDREKLRALRDGKRWLAAYDLAYGRAMAAKARVDGYNGMLAVLKRGRNFTNPASKTWVLQTDDKCPEAGSQIEKLISESKRYLQQVIADHPGTPWAEMAKQELQSPMGWKWTEQ